MAASARAEDFSSFTAPEVASVQTAADVADTAMNDATSILNTQTVANAGAQSALLRAGTAAVQAAAAVGMAQTNGMYSLLSTYLTTISQIAAIRAQIQYNRETNLMNASLKQEGLLMQFANERQRVWLERLKILASFGNPYRHSFNSAALAVRSALFPGSGASGMRTTLVGQAGSGGTLTAAQARRAALRAVPGVNTFSSGLAGGSTPMARMRPAVAARELALSTGPRAEPPGAIPHDPAFRVGMRGASPGMAFGGHALR